MLITQWPRDITRRPGGSAEVHCYQNDTDYQYLYWYKQLRGGDIQLIVMLVVGKPTIEDKFKSSFQATSLTEKHWSLNISSVQQKDEAFYLCAASLHSAAADLRSVTKTYFLVLTPDSHSQLSSKGGNSTTVRRRWYQWPLMHMLFCLLYGS